VPEVPSAVVEYIQVLVDSRDATTAAGDRAAYDRHLASAARLVGLVARNDDSAVDEWLDAEEHGFGWGYLSGDEGDRAEQAFAALKRELTAG
jgi:hypothetical protein